MCSIIDGASAAETTTDDVPDFLDAKNRTPLSPEKQAKLDADMKAAREKPIEPEAAKILADQAERKRTKREVRKEKAAAEKEGKSTALPPSGKAALALITGKSAKPKRPAKTKAAAKAKAPAKAKAKKADGAKAKKPAAAKAAKPKAKGSTKVEVIASLLKRKEGCTTAEVLKATGWPSVSMPQQAKAASLKLRKVKEGSVSRYFGS